MFLKMMVFIAFVAGATTDHHHAFSSQHIGKHDGHYEVISHGHGKKHHYDFFTYPKYKFAYKLEDHHTKNHKRQHKMREHDDVKGFYSPYNPDSTERHGHYHRDKHSRFHADLKHSTHHIYHHHH